MKDALLALVLALIAFLIPSTRADDRSGPVRVLFVGHEAEHHNSGAYAPMLMQALGRDGIWFDYVTTPEATRPNITIPEPTPRC